MTTACRVWVTGLVQGVGFRPFVHRLAMRHHLDGWVRNGSGDVQIAVEGSPPEVVAFLEELRSEAPPLARIEGVTAESVIPEGLGQFAILPSTVEANGRQPVSPDVAMCSHCEVELFDPTNRRFGYGFITCTDCGPRFTVIQTMPYDRERTSMVAFQQCSACQAEYDDPSNRRHHSETNSCPRCGPRLWFGTGHGDWTARSRAAILGAAELLTQGGILALRGLGGFHLAVDATDGEAVSRLRARKRREAKPLAVMVRTLDQARQIAEITPAEAALLTGSERPIVLVGLRAGAGVALQLAPGLTQIGLLLAYTPLHHLLVHAVGRPLVMTSGNASEEPIATGNDEAMQRLLGIADGFLLHDREIVQRYDDSVMRVVRDRPVVLRRARGYAPMPLQLPVPTPRPLVAVGPHLKNTFTLAEGGTAWVSQHIGDLENLETLAHFRSALDAYRRLFRIDPEIVVRDSHSGYLSTRIAAEMGLSSVIAVQHHHAHIAAVLGEHGETGPVLGVAFDGTGAGDDGTSWGAEFLLADVRGYRRVGHLRPAPMPGGDRASRTPWRAALGYLSLEPGYTDLFEPAFRGVDPLELEVARRQIDRGVNAPLASSMGRLFDAAAAIIGVRRTASYEGQAAMELEALAGRRPATEYPAHFHEVDGCWILDPLPLLATLAARRSRGADPANLAADFHASVAWGTAEMVRRTASSAGVTAVALGGGSFQNARLLESLVSRLEFSGFRVLTPRRLPANDGAISYGQAAVAAALLASA